MNILIHACQFRQSGFRFRRLFALALLMSQLPVFASADDVYLRVNQVGYRPSDA